MKAGWKAWLAGGLLLVLPGLVGCGPSLSGEDSEQGALKQARAAVEYCPQEPVMTANGSVTPACNTFCGDGMCRSGENQYNCPDDCGSPSYCGDGYCSAAGGETENNCPSDCYCGDGVCNGSDTVNSCPMDCGCPSVCGNGVCSGNESTANCWNDCGTLCGDHVCNGGENLSNCARDCGYCGDGLCYSPETRYNCPSDCGGTSCPPNAEGLRPVCQEPVLE